MPNQEADAGTPIILKVDTTLIPATLNKTLTARRFREKLPFTIALQRYESDYCSSAPPLETDDTERQFGWKNGDIGYFGGWFTILFGGQESSKNTSGVLIIGRVDEGHLDAVRGLGRSITVTIDLA